MCSVLFTYQSLAGSLAGLTLVGAELLSPASVCAVLMLTCCAASSSMVTPSAVCLLCVCESFIIDLLTCFGQCISVSHGVLFFALCCYLNVCSSSSTF